MSSMIPTFCQHRRLNSSQHNLYFQTNEMQHIFQKNPLIIRISREQLRKSLWFTRSCNSVVNLQNHEEIQTKLIGKAMKAYLERSKEHDIFMKQQHHEYQIGKRHLANMMGEDPDVFSQTDIDSAIEYLFPSGLYDKKARPMMKLPEEIFPQRKAAEFDESGRPFHFMFYTGKPHFYKLLYDIVENINNLLNYEDSRAKSNSQPDTNLILDLNGYQWLQKEALETVLLETIGDKDYESFINAMERLYNLQYSYKVKEFILTYKKLLLSRNKTSEISKLCYDKDDKAYITTYECCRKRAIGNVTVYYPGLGEIIINGQNLDYFKEIQPREQVLFPLLFTNMMGKVKIEASVQGGGPSGQAGAIRWGIANCLKSFVSEDMVEKMRLAGLLTRDFRTKERKKPGQEKARKKFTWKKR